MNASTSTNPDNPEHAVASADQARQGSATEQAPGNMEIGISLSDKAADHVRRYLAKRGKGLGLRLGVRTTGCSGLAYKLEYVDAQAEDDLVFESQGLSIFIDPRSLPYLQGIMLDYTREGLNEGFKFINPNEKARCGCGESFTV